MKHYAALLLALSVPLDLPAAKLLNGNLDNWEVIGDGIWMVLRDGVLVGQRDLKKAENQSWLYTKKNDYGEFDLHLEWWTRADGNSGVSIRDTSRAQYAVGAGHDPQRTPAHIGYEIQISNGDGDEYPTGSVYLFAKAKADVQHDFDWNSLDIESRNNLIRVKLNGQVVAEYPGEPDRPKAGPIGLQLHDHTALAMFRNIRIQEVGK